MLSIIIPAHNEERFLNWTINNIFSTCQIEPEVVVIDQGGNGEIDKRAVIVRPGENVGEREAMNLAVETATNEFLLRIDAHCDFSPQGWDVLMCESTDEKDITVAVLTAVELPWEHAEPNKKQKWLAAGKKKEDWPGLQRLKGHWYGFSKLIVNSHNGIEAKWQKPNRDHNAYKPLEPNMGLTGCGFMIRKSFYKEIGGADESLPKMGAIGEEFAIKAWAHGGKVQTRTDCMIGHVFGTGGYDTSGVHVAQEQLYLKYGKHIPVIHKTFPSWENLSFKSALQPGKPIRTVTVNREDKTVTTDNNTGKVIRTKIEYFQYVWLDNEHQDEKDWTDKQIEQKYAPLAVKVGEDIKYADRGSPTQEGVIVTP